MVRAQSSLIVRSSATRRGLSPRPNRGGKVQSAWDDLNARRRPQLVNETDAEIDAAFAALVDKSARALLVGVDPFFDTRLDRIVALAAQWRLPANDDHAPPAGYGARGDLAYAYEHFGIYAGKILKGAKPADLPRA